MSKTEMLKKGKCQGSIMLKKEMSKIKMSEKENVKKKLSWRKNVKKDVIEGIKKRR